MREVKRPEVRRAEIVEAAQRLFAGAGYENVTVEAITSSLGVAKGCFYHYFRSKDDVFAACVHSLSSTIAASIETIFDDRALSPRARLGAYLDFSYDLAANGGRSELMSDLHSTGFHDLHGRAAEDVVAKVRPTLTALLEEGVAAGEFRLIDPEFTAVALLGALRALHDAAAHRTNLDLATHRRLVEDLLDRVLDTRRAT